MRLSHTLTMFARITNPCCMSDWIQTVEHVRCDEDLDVHNKGCAFNGNFEWKKNNVSFILSLADVSFNPSMDI